MRISDYNENSSRNALKGWYIMSKNYTCCFTGHRPEKLPWGADEYSEDCILLKLKQIAEIEKLRRRGVTTFITGMAQGADIFAAEAVWTLKLAYPQEVIRLIAVRPYEGQADRWSAEYRERYYNILAVADEEVILRPHYSRGCMQERNRYMVDRAAHMIAVYNGEVGGTKYTVDYAVKKGLEVVVIDPRDMSVNTLPPFRGFKLIK